MGISKMLLLLCPQLSLQCLLRSCLSPRRYPRVSKHMLDFFVYVCVSLDCGLPDCQILNSFNFLSTLLQCAVGFLEEHPVSRPENVLPSLRTRTGIDKGRRKEEWKERNIREGRQEGKHSFSLHLQHMHPSLRLVSSTAAAKSANACILQTLILKFIQSWYLLLYVWQAKCQLEQEQIAYIDPNFGHKTQG